MSKDIKEVRQCYTECSDYWAEQRARMLEDQKFSNPANPQQWDLMVAQARGASRVMLTLDRTNPYIMQVVNDQRRNKPSIDTMPADSKADPAVSSKLDGLIRQIEYTSRAQVAYDMAADGAARTGIGWFRVYPKIMDPRSRQQDICIGPVPDPRSIVADEDFIMPDGSDITYAFAETKYSMARFKAKWPKADVKGFEAGSKWYEGDDKGVLVLEHQCLDDNKVVMLEYTDQNGETQVATEQEFMAMGAGLIVTDRYEAIDRTVIWQKLNGNEILEETTVKCRWVGFVPVFGFAMWVEGKRHMAGVPRVLMNAQRAYNYNRSAETETIALQPKAPIMAAAAAIAGHDEHYSQLNNGSPALLPWNHLDKDGNAIPKPERMLPPTYPVAYQQGAQEALCDMEAALGMYKASMGAPSNETSGKAIRERREAGDTATYHFSDYGSQSVAHGGRIIVDMIPSYYDTARQARIMGLEGKSGTVQIDPSLSGAVKRNQQGKVVAINPGVGVYDVRARAGANYMTQREEAAVGLETMMNAAPQFAPVLGPLLIKLRDMPDGDRYSRMLMAMAPPEVRAIFEEEDGGDIPPQVAQKLREYEQQLKMAMDALKQSEAHMKDLERQLKDKMGAVAAQEATKRYEIDRNHEIAQHKADTERIASLNPPAQGMTTNQVQALVMQMMTQVSQEGRAPPVDPAAVAASAEELDATPALQPAAPLANGADLG